MFFGSDYVELEDLLASYASTVILIGLETNYFTSLGHSFHMSKTNKLDQMTSVILSRAKDLSLFIYLKIFICKVRIKSCYIVQTTYI